MNKLALSKVSLKLSKVCFAGLLFLGLLSCAASHSKGKSFQDNVMGGVSRAMLSAKASNTMNIAQDLDTPEAVENIEPYITILLDRRDKLGLCEFNVEREEALENSQVYKIGEESYLVELQCFFAAYQGAYEYYLLTGEPDDYDIKPLSLKIFYQNESGEWVQEETRDIGGMTNFNLEEQILEIFSKGIGAGTCGSFARYQFEGEQFKVIEYRVKEDCEGEYIDPENYPQVYP